MIKKVITGLIGLSLFPATFSFATPFNGGLLIGDQSLDQIALARDLNGDGDANDTGEMTVYFDGSNNAGLSSPTDNVFTIHQASSGYQFFGDGNTDSVYRIADLNGNGNAQDAGEANIWFSGSNAAGLPLLTPNGLAEGSDGAIYIVEADVLSTPNGDFVYRTEDLNGDGDAQDAGEATVWLDLKALNPSSSPFEITFSGDAAFISDTVGRETNVIYRAQDQDGNGTVESDEVTEFITGDNTFGVPVDFAIAADSDSLYVWEFLDRSGPQSVFRLNDRNGNNLIDDLTEVMEVWNDSLLPDGFETSVAFSMAAGPGGELMLTSNGSAANQDNLIRLIDRNGDGDYLDNDETIIFASRELNGAFPERPRSLAYLSAAEIPNTDTALLILSGLLFKILFFTYLTPRQSTLINRPSKHS